MLKNQNQDEEEGNILISDICFRQKKRTDKDEANQNNESRDERKTILLYNLSTQELIRM